MTADTDIRTPDHADLENLFVNNAKLGQIERYLGRFNPIRVMKMERMEIRHSSIIAWLLDPSETHGLADEFLKAFLGEALRGHNADVFPNALDLSLMDLRDAEVRCEWQNIDIFVFSATVNLGFIIENKFDSRQHSGQLEKYAKKVAELYEFQGGKKPIIRGVFLTLHEEAPEDESYAVIDYETICNLLSGFMDRQDMLLAPEVAVFLKHYVEILKEATGMSDEQNTMEKLARQLYRTHKKALDFVMEHGASSDFAMAAHTVFGDDIDRLGKVTIDRNTYRFGHMDSYQVSFLPEKWYRAFGEDRTMWPGCEDWWCEYPLVAWVALREGNDGAKGQLRLYGEVGPLSNHELRSGLIEGIRDVESKRIRFQKGAAEEGRRYSKFFKDNSIEIKDIQDAEEMAEAMKKLLQRFKPEFDAIAKILPQFIEYAEDAE